MLQGPTTIPFWALNDPVNSPFTVTDSSNSIEGVSGYIHGGLTSGKRYVPAGCRQWRQQRLE